MNVFGTQLFCLPYLGIFKIFKRNFINFEAYLCNVWMNVQHWNNLGTFFHLLLVHFSICFLITNQIKAESFELFINLYNFITNFMDNFMFVLWKMFCLSPTKCCIWKLFPINLINFSNWVKISLNQNKK